MASVSVRWRAGRSRGATPGRSNRRVSWSAITGAGSRPIREAASSIPSGSPSRWSQISATALRFSSVSPKDGSARRARSTNRPIASEGSSRPTGNSCSRPSRSGARLVTTTRTSGPARSRSAWICAAAGIRCSKLSRTSRIDRPDRNAWSRSSDVVCGDSTRPNVPAIASRTSSGSSIPSRRTSHAPSAKEAARAARGLDGKAGLARAARSRQRDERRLAEQAFQHLELAVPPDEAGQATRQVPGGTARRRRAAGSSRAGPRSRAGGVARGDPGRAIDAARANARRRRPGRSSAVSARVASDSRTWPP